MTRAGLANALQALQLNPGETAALWAVFEVETAGVTQGFGFRADRRPQILFERHKFRSFTEKRFDSVAPDVSGSAGGYGPFAAQYPKLQKALALCEDAGLGPEPALKSASWGIGQAMGFNHEVAGFPTATAMVQAMVESEDAQLAGMVGFLVHNRLDDALRARDWTTFARIYNGSNYAQFQYDVKLEVQYARFASGSTPDIEVRTAQAALMLLDFSPGKIDGVVGKRTRDGIRGFQISSGLPVTGELDSATYSTLFNAAFKEV